MEDFFLWIAESSSSSSSSEIKANDFIIFLSCFSFDSILSVGLIVFAAYSLITTRGNKDKREDQEANRPLMSNYSINMTNVCLSII